MAGRAEAGVARVGISRLHHPVLTLGPGRRIGIWFQGCSIHCAGCMSRDTWDPAEDGDQVPVADVVAWAGDVADGSGGSARGADDVDRVDGVTISGGEPFDQPAALEALARGLRERLARHGVDILVYTGYSLARVVADHPAALTHVDALVTEPYRQQARPPLRWRGSGNQRLVPLTDLGRARYAAHVDAPADTGLQVDARDGELRLIGVPRPGDLRRIEQGLAARGVALEGCSWLP